MVTLCLYQFGWWGPCCRKSIPRGQALRIYSLTSLLSFPSLLSLCVGRNMTLSPAGRPDSPAAMPLAIMDSVPLELETKTNLSLLLHLLLAVAFYLGNGRAASTASGSAVSVPDNPISVSSVSPFVVP